MEQSKKDKVIAEALEKAEAEEVRESIKKIVDQYEDLEGLKLIREVLLRF